MTDFEPQEGLPQTGLLQIEFIDPHVREVRWNKKGLYETKG